MSAYHAEVISDTPGSERVEIYEVAALGHNGKLVDILVGDKARDYIRQFLADCEEREPAPEPTRVKTRAVLLGLSATTARKSCDVMNKSTRYDGLNFRPAWNPPDGYMILVTGASIPAGIEAYVSGVTDALLAKLPTSEGG